MKVVILCDGRPPVPAQIKKELRSGTFFIAADGGASTAKKLNLVPDLIIGDMDSYTPDPEEKNKIVYEPDQETNDLEKALHYAHKKNATEVIVFGATGKRLDHTLKNLSVLKQFDSRFQRIIFKDPFSDIYLIHSPFRKEFPVGTSISLFPLLGKVTGITTKGLKYPLSKGILENGIRDGSSNESVNKIVEILFENGDLLFFKNHQPDSF